MQAAKGVLLERSDARVKAALATGSHTWVPTVRRTMRNEGPVHATAAVDLLRRHAVPSLPPLILWMLGGGQGLLTRSGLLESLHFSGLDVRGLVTPAMPFVAYKKSVRGNPTLLGPRTSGHGQGSHALTSQRASL